MSRQDWLDAVRKFDGPRIDKLKLIASGPKDRIDVQAATRLLLKPNYRGKENTK